MATITKVPRQAPVPPAAPARTRAQAPAAPAPTGPVAVDVRGLSKRFGDIEAVREVSLTVAKGEVFAFLGPNGAGKSTTIKMLCTLLTPTAGSATVAGYDIVSQPRGVRRRIGLVFQERTLDDQLTAEENLRFHAVLYGVPGSEIEERIARVLATVELTERRKDLVGTFSGGMARRLEIARALLHAPDVLFLDEPTIGLDPQTRARMWQDVLRLRKEHGITIFLTTHYMDEAEYADRIAIIDHGKIVALGTPASLKASVGLDSVRIATADDASAAERLRRAGYDATPTEKGLVVRVADGEEAVAGLVAAVGVPVKSVSVHRPTLDDVFLHFTGREIRGDQADAGERMKRAMSMYRGARR